MSDYPKAAPGAGLILFRPISDTSLEVLLSVRTKNVGAGYGITGGGFVDCEKHIDLPVASVVETIADAYREAYEENDGFEKLIGIEFVKQHAQSIFNATVRVDDVNQLHSVDLFALRVPNTEGLWDEIAALPPGLDENGTPEREEDLQICRLDISPDIMRINPEMGVQLHDSEGKELFGSDFCYDHEFKAIALIGWHYRTGRLWL